MPSPAIGGLGCDRLDMKFFDTDVVGARRIVLERRTDERGFFARAWCRSEFAEAGVDVDWVQANAARSTKAGTLRGLHFQRPPFDEVKLVRCTRGAVFDVAVDLRPDSPTYRGWSGLRLDADGADAFLIPAGCAHGYLTLTDDVDLYYLTSTVYEPAAAAGVRYDDPAFGIVWPRAVEVISAQDATWPGFAL